MDYRAILADFAKWLDAGASTVVGNVDDLSEQYLRARAASNNMLPGNTLASGN